MNEDFLDQLRFNADGLIPAIVQERKTGRVLMMAWMNRDSLLKTLETKRTWFWSRSRRKYWMKGESSGHVQRVEKVAFDCDGDTLLLEVEQVGAACHEGYKSCFFRNVSFEGEVRPNDEPLVKPEAVYKDKIKEARRQEKQEGGGGCAPDSGAEKA
ncbi:MAG: phosphoribosyl-AMP cyclohydrolase [Verrucomicrobiae bacterium]|nr:phosphoribosyl-AMP cyclohydrolase [Verrucomicrobiae bacterium]